MRWYSTVDSSDKLEFSVLAAIESLIAVSLSLYLAWTFQTVLHIVITACLAPFLLLRSEESTERGLRYFAWFLDHLDTISDHFWIFIFFGISIFSISIYLFLDTTLTLWFLSIWLISTLIFFLADRFSILDKLPILLKEVARAVVVAVGVVVVSLSSKLAATLQTLFLSPFKSLHEIPNNWFRIVFSMDSLHPPELVPGAENTHYLTTQGLYFNDELRFSGWFSENIDNLTSSDWIDKAFGLLYLLLTPILFLPALAYRWSLKSSSIIWLPLIWIVGWKRQKVEDANTQVQINLSALRHTAWAKLTVTYAFIVVFVLTLLPFILKGQAITYQAHIDTLFNGELINNLINFFFAFHMEAWHWSRLAVALLTLVAFFYADRLLNTRKYLPEAGLTSAPLLLRTITLLRAPLSLFTIICGFWLLLSPINWQAELQQLDWLPVGLLDFIKSLISKSDGA